MSDTEKNKASAGSGGKKTDSAALEPGKVRTGSKKNFIVDFNSEVPALEHGQNPVVHVYDEETQKDLVAYLCARRSLPRLSDILTYKYVGHPNLLKYIASSPVVDPETRQEYIALIFENQKLRPLLDKLKSDIPKLKPDDVKNKIMLPILDCLYLFQKSDMVHGAINLKNIFIKGDLDNYEIVLGECLSAAVSKENPVLYETIDNALADPAGRGVATVKNDLYSLGVCVAMLVWQVNPLSDMSDTEIIQRKIEKGSFGLFASRRKVSSEIIEFLRGVLNDDSSQRWDFDDVAKWLEGQRLSPKQPSAQLKAPRGFEYKDKKYNHLRSLVHTLGREGGDSAYSVLSSTEFLKWFTRNFSDKNIMANVENILERSKTAPKSGAFKDRYTAEMIMALDPHGPIRFKNVSLHVRGFGTSLAEAFAREDNIQVYPQLLDYQLHATWLSMQFNVPAYAAQLSTEYERYKQFVKQKSTGLGIERVLYMACRDAPCMSPQFKQDFVYDGRQLLIVMNRHARAGTLQDPLFDRHIITYLSVREAKMIEPHMSLVGSSQKSSHILGVIKTLAAIQKKESPGPMVGICDYLIDKSVPVLDNIYNADLREAVKAKMQSLRGKGDLTALLSVLNDERMLSQDARGFQAAKKEYQLLELRKENIAGTSERKRKLGLYRGKQVAMILSATLASVGILINMIKFFMG